MKKILLAVIILTFLGVLIYTGTGMYQFAAGVKKDAQEFNPLTIGLKNKIQNGDIIFQTSKSSKSKAVQLATNSKYSHMGIIYENDGEYFVYEAVQPVKLTPLQKWINRGKNGHYVVKRLANAESILTDDVMAEMKIYGERFKGKSYDKYFEWSDDKIYCSELVWKIYKEVVNIEIGKLERLSDFDLTDKIVQSKMKERYGDNIPMD